jgi:RNA polymerase sigma-70 factor (ECF subfamily)
MRPEFDLVFAAEFPALHRYLRRRVGASLAEDIAASVFAAAFRGWDRLDETRPVRPWLYGIAANLVRRHRRAEVRELRAYARSGVDSIALDDAVEGRLAAQACRRELAAALAELRPQQREILLLHAWAELSDAEIATALSLPLGTVKSSLSRTRERLRRRLAVTAPGLPLNTVREEPR